MTCRAPPHQMLVTLGTVEIEARLASPACGRYHLRLLNQDVTPLLNALGQGDPYAASRPLPLVYVELRKLAAQRMVQEQPSSVRLGLEDRQ